MRSLFAVLAAAAVASTASAYRTFSKASCTDWPSSLSTITAAETSNGAWTCLGFGVGRDSTQELVFDVTDTTTDYELQVLLWNDELQGDSSADTRWRTTGDMLYLARAGMGEDPTTDLNAAVVSDTDTDAYAAWGLSGRMGYINDDLTSGYHTLYSTGTQILPGRNLLQLRHPDAPSTNTVADFSGKMLYRIVRADTPTVNSLVHLNSMSAADMLETFGAAELGKEYTIEAEVLPGDEFSVPLDIEFAKVGYALKGLKYSVAISGVGVGSFSALPEVEMGLPVGYSVPGSAATSSRRDFPDFTSYDESSGFWSATLDMSTSTGVQLYYNTTGDDTFGVRDPDTDMVFASNTNTYTREWTVPLDVSSVSDWPSFGSVYVEVPDLENADSGATSRPYNYGSQSSPFWTVSVTIETVTTYPMLSSLDDLTLRNWAVQGDGHSIAEVQAQTPFAMYMLKIDSPYWERAEIKFNNVQNLNVDASAPSGTTLPNCQPLYEVQVIRAPPTPGAGSSSYPHYTNGFGDTFVSYSQYTSGSPQRSEVGTSSFDVVSFEVSPRGKADYALTLNNNFWRYGQSQGSLYYGSSQHIGDELLSLDTNYGYWFMIRVVAAPASRDAECGSSNIMIGSATVSTSSVVDQCESSLDCMVKSADNPNKDAKDDSANGKADRFSQCILAPVMSNGRVVGRSKCVECQDNSQCGAQGQYCSLWTHTCEANDEEPHWYPIVNTQASPDNRFDCSEGLMEQYGTCVEKSPDVLGEKCRPGLGSDVEGVFPGIVTLNAMHDATPDNKDFMEGTAGFCGEYVTLTGAMDTNVGSGKDIYLTRNGYYAIALWQGYCTRDRVCMECVPGSASGGSGSTSTSSSSGGGTTTDTEQVCLNGKLYAAMDVDDTARSFAQNTVAGTTLSTTFMVILLIVLFGAYMLSEAKRARAAAGAPPMTCCECLLCCGACSSDGGLGTKASKGSEKQVTPTHASAPPTTNPGA